MSVHVRSLAETEYNTGHRENAERSLADAEKGYAIVSRFLSDPTHAAHMPPEAHQEFNTELERLRQTLDELRRIVGTDTKTTNC